MFDANFDATADLLEDSGTDADAVTLGAVPPATPAADPLFPDVGNVRDANTGGFSGGSSGGDQQQEVILAVGATPLTAIATDPQENVGTLATPFTDPEENAGTLATPFKVAAPAFVSSLSSEPSLSINDTADHVIPSSSINDTADHVINAAESRAVAFTVSGLDARTDGKVTFTDAAAHQVVVNVGGNGTYSADLSNLSDGTITSSLLTTNPDGVGSTATGNPAALDTGSGLDPALSVYAANPSNVIFTVSGLASDYSGTVTFTDTTGKSDAVAIGSNGTYSANLSNLTDGTLTYVMKVSDPAGNVITVDPTTTLGLPPGVTLQQIDGGPNYYANFTDAANAGWDNPDFIPIGPFLGTLVAQSDASLWETLGWNTAWNLTASSSLSVADANGISVVQNVQGGGTGSILPGTGAETVGLETFDEPSSFAEGVTTPLSTTPNSLQDGRFWYVNNTWNFIAYGGLAPIGPSSPAWTSSAQVLDSKVTTPDGTQAEIAASSLDAYWFAGASISEIQYEVSLIYGVSNVTADEVARGSNYGTVVADERLATGGNTPIYGIVELGGAYTGDTSASDYITPPELNWAVWSELINGARGIVYFNNAFAGPGATNDIVETLYYQTVQPGQTVSIDTQVEQTDALVEQMAPVLNSPTALGYVTVSPAPQDFSGIETLVKDDNGQFYIFADTRDSLTQTNITAVFTIADLNATSVTVVGENRTIPVVDGVFTDTFATAATVHIYEVNDPGVSPPPPLPAAPVISSGVANSNATVTLTGTAPDGSTITVSDTGGTTALGTVTASGSGAWSFTTAALATGSYAFTVTDTTSAGTSADGTIFINVASASGTKPAVPVISTGVENPIASVTLSGTAADGSTVTVSDAGGMLGTTTANGTGAWSFTTAPLVAGAYAFSATDTTSTGTSAASSAFDVTVTSSTVPPPAAPVISASVENSNDSVTLTGTAPDGSTVTVSDAGGMLDTVTASSSGTWSFTTAANLAVGSYAFTATDTTSAGTSAASSPFDMTVTAVPPPAAPVIGSGVANSNGSVTLAGTAPDGSVVIVSDAFGTLGTTSASSTGTWSLTTPDLANGSYAFSATDTTSAGTSAASSPLDVTVTSSSVLPPAAPVISAGVANSNQSVTLTGTAPDGSTVTVSDGGANALGAVTASSSGTWSFTTAANLVAGTYAFTATDATSAGASAASSAFDVTVPVNLVVNGNFATDSFSGWTLGGNYTSTTYGPEIFIDTNAQGGSTYAAGMGSVSSDGTLSQTIATTPGQTYTLSFWLDNEASGSNDFTAIWNGQTLLSLSNADAFGYTQYTYTVTATSSSTTLEFSAANGPSQWDLDNISLIATGPTGPTVSVLTESPSSGDLDAGKTVTYTLTMSEVVTVNTTGGSPTLSLNDGGTATYVSGSGSDALTFSYTVLAGQNTPDLTVASVNLNGATVKDGSGNAANFSLTGITQGSPEIDTTPPTVSSVTATAGDYDAGKALTLTLNMSEAVNVTGTPTLTLNDGGTATYVSGSGSSALVFSYTVAAGQNTSALEVTGVTGTITDLAGNALSTAGLPETFTGVIIDTTAPTVSSVTATAGDYDAGKALTLTLTMSEAVDVTGTPTLTLNDGGTATYVSGSGSSALVFSYTVAAGQNTSALEVTGVTGTIKDLAGNALSTAGLPETFTGVIVDTTAPTVSSVTATAGDYDAGKALTLTLTMSEAVDVTGTPTLTLNDGGTATYVSGSGSSALVFSYTVAAGQNTSALEVTGVTGTIKDLAGNALSTAGLPETFTGVIVDTTAPTVSSVTATAGDYDAGKALTLTLNMSEAVNVTGTPTLTLNDGGTATYVSGSGSSALVFSYTVAAGQNTSALEVTGVTGTITDLAGNALSTAGLPETFTGVIVNTTARRYRR